MGSLRAHGHAGTCPVGCWLCGSEQAPWWSAEESIWGKHLEALRVETLPGRWERKTVDLGLGAYVKGGKGFGDDNQGPRQCPLINLAATRAGTTSDLSASVSSATTHAWCLKGAQELLDE